MAVFLNRMRPLVVHYSPKQKMLHLPPKYLTSFRSFITLNEIVLPMWWT